MPKYSEGAVSPSGKFVVQGGEWVPVSEQMPNFADVQGGTSSGGRVNRAWELARAGVPTGMMPVVAAEEGPEKEEALRTMTAAATLPIAVQTGGAIGGRLLPFLLRMGAGRRAAGAVAGGAASLPAAVPQLVRGDIGGAAKSVAAGAVTGGIAPGLFGAGRAAEAALPAAAGRATTLTPDIANRLRQIAETSGANKALVKKILGEMGDEGAALWDVIKAARTRI